MIRNLGMRNIEINQPQIEKEITDLQMIGKVITSLFPRIPISMYHENEQIPIQLISANTEGIVIKATDRQDKGIRVLTFTNNFSLYHFWFELSPGSNSDIEFLRPLKMVIRDDAKRIESRSIIEDKPEGKPQISDLISQEDLFLNPEKLKKVHATLVEKFGAAIREKFQNFILKLDGIEDLRLRIFKAGLRPIFLPNPGKLDPFNTAFFNPYQFKELLIAYQEQMVGAEITIPILLKSRILIGYLKISGDKPLLLEDYTFLQKASNQMMDEIASHPELITIPGMFELVDISSNGLGFKIPSSPENQTHTSPGKILLFDFKIGESTKLTLRCISRYQKEENHSLRIGVEFYDITPDEKANLREFAKSLGDIPPKDSGK